MKPATLVVALSLLAPGPGLAAQFDYWALALSWSPSYCLSDAGRGDKSQCGQTRDYAFVVHGLWPQRMRGWPQYCGEKPKRPGPVVIKEALAFMPSPKLVRHQWSKHGTCTGLSPEAYFGLTAKLFARIEIPAKYRGPRRPVLTSPDALRRDFIAANPWLKAGMLSIQCGNRRDRGRLRELRVCFDRDGGPRACGANERRQCNADTLVLPPVR